MSRSELPDRSPEVIALLRAHGAPPTAARLLARLGETLRRQTDQTGTEFAILVDLEDEQQRGNILSGSEDRVPLTSHLRLLQPGRRYAHLHTHPWSTCFSDFDLAILLQNIPLRITIVVGRDGSWYVLSKLRGKPTASWQAGLIAWNQALNLLNPRLDREVDAGALTEAQATRQLWEAIVAQVAPDLGLRYDHLEPW